MYKKYINDIFKYDSKKYFGKNAIYDETVFTKLLQHPWDSEPTGLFLIQKGAALDGLGENGKKNPW